MTLETLQAFFGASLLVARISGETLAFILTFTVDELEAAFYGDEPGTLYVDMPFWKRELIDLQEAAKEARKASYDWDDYEEEDRFEDFEEDRFEDFAESLSINPQARVPVTVGFKRAWRYRCSTRRGARERRWMKRAAHRAERRAFKGNGPRYSPATRYAVI